MIKNSEDGDKAIRMMLGYLCIASEREASVLAKVEILDRFDLADAEIASIAGTSVQVVRDSRSRLKKRSKRSKK